MVDIISPRISLVYFGIDCTSAIDLAHFFSPSHVSHYNTIIVISFYYYFFIRTLKTKMPKDRQMHHISVTWDNKAGNWQLYMNGQLAESGTGLNKGHVIPRGGTAVIGQDQDIMGGGFELQDAFGPGVVGSLNMWDKILSECDIAKQVVTCNIPHGSVLGMYQF